jgi:hypothetical protein
MRHLKPSSLIPRTFMRCVSLSYHYILGEGNVNTKSLVKVDFSFICLGPRLSSPLHNMLSFHGEELLAPRKI